MVLANARNGNSVQRQTQLIVHRKLSHNHNFFTSLAFILQDFCLGLLWPSAIWKLKSQPQCSREPETPAPRPGKVPHCLPKPAASEIPANPSPSQGCSAWLVGEQALSLRPRQILSDPFGTNPPLRGMKSSFVFTYTEWLVQLRLLPYITYTGSDRRQGRKWVVKSQKFSLPVQI